MRLAISGALLMALATGCNQVEVEEIGAAGFGDPAALAADIDAEVRSELAQGRIAEARGWLDHPDHALFEGDPDEVKTLVGDLYHYGARKVWFTGIEFFGATSVTASLAVELPDDATIRRELLEREARFLGATETAPDVGQLYLSIVFD